MSMNKNIVEAIASSNLAITSTPGVLNPLEENWAYSHSVTKNEQNWANTETIKSLNVI
jgi:hypothetical protein